MRVTPANTHFVLEVLAGQKTVIYNHPGHDGTLRVQNKGPEFVTIAVGEANPQIIDPGQTTIYGGQELINVQADDKRGVGHATIGVDLIAEC
ncbi:MAG: hypothetical protein JO316_20700 [Abitibacteriaceae bacterium]|nr:hypothetical protein [Abditibacteriaceae bacterium]MBV9867779.1 hypothetical protein [Abditibacteriaceae bacterium]